MKRASTVLALLAVVAGAASPAVLAHAAGRPERSAASVGASRRGVVGWARDARAPAGPFHSTPAGERLRSRGYLVPDEAGYARTKAAAGRRAGVAPDGETGSRAPSVGLTFQGVDDPQVTPSDSNGAIGPNRYIEVVNLQYGIYDRTGVATSAGPLWDLVGAPNGYLSLSDPTVIWDPGTKRFYYNALDVSVTEGSWSGADYWFGYSKTASPNGPADFCPYRISYGYGANGFLPDYPKLGDTKDFLITGANIYNMSDVFVEADAQWVTKPASGSTCQSPSLFRAAARFDLKNADGSGAHTPEPANQTDTSSKGYIVSAQYPGGGTASKLQVFTVKKDTATGDGIISQTGKAITVPSYAIPPYAPQKGTTKKLDTIDSRLLLSVSAVDPGHGGKVGIWTEHTVAGGAGSEVRWYELDPVGLNVLQSGAATSGSLFAFNGAIAPDRHVNGSSKLFGDSMVLTFDTSSSNAYSAIQVLSKIGAAAQSGFTLVKQSPGKNIDFSCNKASDNLCRWGDYAGATPDPASPTGGAHGQVWITSLWNVASATNGDADWRTQNALIQP